MKEQKLTIRNIDWLETQIKAFERLEEERSERLEQAGEILAVMPLHWRKGLCKYCDMKDSCPGHCNPVAENVDCATGLVDWLFEGQGEKKANEQ